MRVFKEQFSKTGNKQSLSYFFPQKMGNSHVWRNFLEQLRINGDYLVGEANIKKGFARSCLVMLFEGISVQV